MRRAEGSLTTGTYIAITQVDNKDHISRARSKDVGHEVVGTRDKNDENVEWYCESLGNDHARSWNKTFGTCFKPSIYAEGALIDKESPPDIFITRETETKGEYHFSYAENPSWYICPVEGGSGYKVSKEPTRWSFWKVDV